MGLVRFESGLTTLHSLKIILLSGYPNKVRDCHQQRRGALPGAHGLQGDVQEVPDRPGAGGGEHGRSPQRLHLQVTSYLFYKLVNHLIFSN